MAACSSKVRARCRRARLSASDLLADLELALHEIKNQAIELKQLDRWIRAIASALPAGQRVQDVLDLDQLRAMRHLSKPR